MSTQPYAVIGATGQQGGAVVDALLQRRVPVRALVRDPGAERSRALAGSGVELVRADLNAPDSLLDALRGVEALFMMTTFAGPTGTDGEVEHGRAIGDAAARADVPRVVYSSVGGAERHSGVPHFESKWRVEQYLAGVVAARFVRPTFFMENFARSLDGADGADGEFVLRLPMPGGTPLQMVAVRDVGAVAAALLVDPAAVDGQAIEIAGDQLTGDQAAARIGEHLHRPARYEAVPVDSLGDDEDLKAMFRWFTETPAYAADFAGTRALDPEVLDLAGWLGRSG